MGKQSSKSHQNTELPIFVKWIEFLKWFLPTLEKFPKKSRFTVTNRVENIALDIIATAFFKDTTGLPAIPSLWEPSHLL